MPRRGYAALSIGWLLLVVAPARAQLVQTLFRAEDGTAFQVLRATASVHITTIAGSLAEAASCADAGSAPGAAASAVGRTAAAGTLHPYEVVRRSFVLTPNDLAVLTFAAAASGRVTLGNGAGALVVCADAVDCAGVDNVQPLVELSSSLGGIPQACTAAGIAAACALGHSGDAYAFGLPAHGSSFICDDPGAVTVDANLCAPPPADGFDLPAGSALALVYGGNLQATSFGIAAGGFDIGGGTNPPDCPSGTIVAAVAGSENEPAPTPTPEPIPTRPAIPVVASPLAAPGLLLVAVLGIALVLAVRSPSGSASPPPRR